VIYYLIGFGPLQGVKFTGMALFECGIAASSSPGLIIVITEYYTGTEYRPVKSIAGVFGHGHGTNVNPGPRHLDGIHRRSGAGDHRGILVTYSLAGLFGIAIATTPCWRLAGMIVALDRFGPVTTMPAALPKWPSCRRKSARLMPSATPPRP